MNTQIGFWYRTDSMQIYRLLNGICKIRFVRSGYLLFPQMFIEKAWMNECSLYVTLMTAYQSKSCWFSKANSWPWKFSSLYITNLYLILLIHLFPINNFMESNSEQSFLWEVLLFLFQFYPNYEENIYNNHRLRYFTNERLKWFLLLDIRYEDCIAIDTN